MADGDVNSETADGKETGGRGKYGSAVHTIRYDTSLLSNKTLDNYDNAC